MKKFGIIMMFVAMLGATSCSSLTSATDATAVAAGATCGKALVSLNKENASYKRSFTTGMVTGGSGVITTAMATNLTNSLLNATGLDGVNTSNIAQKAQTVGTILQLLNALNQ